MESKNKKNTDEHQTIMTSANVPDNILYFILLKPLLDEFRAILLYDWTAQFYCFVFVQLGVFQQRAKVFQQRTLLAWGDGHLLQLLHCIRVAKNALKRKKE